MCRSAPHSSGRVEDAPRAEEMFRTLLGDGVEGRRAFILKHRANLEDVDYGA